MLKNKFLSDCTGLYTQRRYFVHNYELSLPHFSYLCLETQFGPGAYSGRTWTFCEKEYFWQIIVSFDCGPGNGGGSSEWEIGGICSPISWFAFTQACETLSQTKAGFTGALCNSVKTTAALGLDTSHRT